MIPTTEQIEAGEREIYGAYAATLPDAPDWDAADAKVQGVCHRLAIAHFARQGGGYKLTWADRITVILRGASDPEPA